MLVIDTLSTTTGLAAIDLDGNRFPQLGSSVATSVRMMDAGKIYIYTCKPICHSDPSQTFAGPEWYRPCKEGTLTIEPRARECAVALLNVKGGYDEPVQ
jgi:hypothetical protein